MTPICFKNKKRPLRCCGYSKQGSGSWIWSGWGGGGVARFKSQNAMKKQYVLEWLIGADWEEKSMFQDLVRGVMVMHEIHLACASPVKSRK